MCLPCDENGRRYVRTWYGSKDYIYVEPFPVTPWQTFWCLLKCFLFFVPWIIWLVLSIWFILL